MKLTIAIVNYNGGPRLKACLESIAAAPPSVPYEVVVVDNDSKDGSADFLKQGAPPQVRFVANAHNLGYTGGYNQAFDMARGEFVMLMNADILARPGSFDALVRHLDEDPTLGAVGGASMSVKGDFEKYVNRFPRVRDVYLTNFVRKEKAMKDEGYRRYHMMDVDFAKPVEVPQPAGGLLMVRRSVFPDGLMGPEFCVFWSDVEIARRVYAAGKRIMVFPDAPFTHDHNWARKPVTESSLLVDLDYYVGCARYFRKWEGRGAALRVKLSFGARLLGRLVVIEFPAALRGEQSWAIWRARARLLWNFLRDRNVLLERGLAAARGS